MIHDENEYHFLRRQILAISTTSEYARANRIGSQMDYNQIPSTIDPLVKAKLFRRQQKEKSIIVHYTYERRFAHYKSKIHQIWNGSFHSTSVIKTKLIAGTRNNPNLTKELVPRSPQPRKHADQQQLQQQYQRISKSLDSVLYLLNSGFLNSF